MTHDHHHDAEHHHHAVPPRQGARALNRLAWSATLHCLTGCSIGEVLGLVLGAAWGLGTMVSIALAVALAFLFGYALTIVPLLRANVPLANALALALASDTVSIAIMEIVDNLVMLAIPGAMSVGLGNPLFWGALVISLVAAALAAYPANRWLIARGRGHAVLHKHHAH